VRQQEGALLEERQKQWEQERQFMQGQVSYFQKQVEENKRMHETLLDAINSNKSQREDN